MGGHGVMALFTGTGCTCARSVLQTTMKPTRMFMPELWDTCWFLQALKPLVGSVWSNPFPTLRQVVSSTKLLNENWTPEIWNWYMDHVKFKVIIFVKELLLWYTYLVDGHDAWPTLTKSRRQKPAVSCKQALRKLASKMGCRHFTSPKRVHRMWFRPQLRATCWLAKDGCCFMLHVLPQAAGAFSVENSSNCYSWLIFEMRWMTTSFV